MPNTTHIDDSIRRHIEGQSATPEERHVLDASPSADESPNAPTPIANRYCASCGERSVNNLCERCDDQYFVCSGCRAVRYIDDRDDDTGQCQNCSCIIDSHGSSPTLVPLGNAPHLGVELEVESNGEYNAHARKIQSTFETDFVIIKSDGSLSEYGFEICSRPASLEKQREAWKPFFDAHQARRFNAQSYTSDRCGLHVHISRNGSPDWQLNEHTVALIVCFVNLPKHKRFIECIAGRHANSYTTLQNKHLNTAARPTGDKYEAVNLNHRNTLEFRIFKGTLKKESFFKALEFTEALTRFCAETYNVRKALNVNSFIKYVYANVDRYRLLAAFIENRWYGKASSLFPVQNWSLYNNRKPPLPPVVLQGEGGR